MPILAFVITELLSIVANPCVVTLCEIDGSPSTWMPSHILPPHLFITSKVELSTNKEPPGSTTMSVTSPRLLESKKLNHNHIFKIELKNTINHLLNNNNNNVDLKKFINNLDQTRNIKITDYIPTFYDYF